jgi:hypothetical protein
MSSRFTSRTIYHHFQWVKIIRDNEKRLYTFERGYLGNPIAHVVGDYPFKQLTCWTAAEIKAKREIQDNP